VSDQACANIAKHDSQRAEREQAGMWRAVGGGGRAGCVNERVSYHGSRDPKVNNRNEAAGKGRTGNKTNAMRMGLFKKKRGNQIVAKAALPSRVRAQIGAGSRARLV